MLLAETCNRYLLLHPAIAVNNFISLFYRFLAQHELRLLT